MIDCLFTPVTLENNKVLLNTYERKVPSQQKSGECILIKEKFFENGRETRQHENTHSNITL